MAEKPKKILYVQYTNPAAFPPLENSALLLANRGWQVKFLGTQALGLENVHLLNHPNIKVELGSYCFPGKKQKLNYFVFILRSAKEMLMGQYSCVYVSDIFATPIGWFACVVLNKRVFYHEHDTPSCAHSRFTQFLHWTRKKLSSQADLCIFPQTERANTFLNQFSAAKVQVCFNMPLKSTAINASEKNRQTFFTLWYHGSLIEERLPFQILEALRILPNDVALKFAGYETFSSEGFLKRFFDKARKLGVENRVQYCGVLETRESLFRQAQECQLGLVLFQKQFVEPMVGASNKPYDYLACGMPILFNDSSEWINFFENQGVGKSCDPGSSESIAQAIRFLVENETEYANMRKRGLEKISTEWNYEAQFAPIQKLLEN
ncbi:MAG: glycosyltransferase family 4 protein [Deltaproteobacteria bacterium]|nr:glycosyltransferase family 4 protein [Deltaproteobacteria bacterium]